MVVACELVVACEWNGGGKCRVEGVWSRKMIYIHREDRLFRGNNDRQCLRIRGNKDKQCLRIMVLFEQRDYTSD